MKLTKAKLKQIIKEELKEAMEKDIKVQKLLNGLYRFYDYRSQLSGLYNPDGTHRSGDLRLNISFVKEKIKEI